MRANIHIKDVSQTLNSKVKNVSYSETEVCISVRVGSDLLHILVEYPARCCGILEQNY